MLLLFLAIVLVSQINVLVVREYRSVQSHHLIIRQDKQQTGEKRERRTVKGLQHIETNSQVSTEHRRDSMVALTPLIKRRRSIRVIDKTVKV